MEEKIIQIIPAPANLMYSYGGEDANHVVCLALVESEDGDREICLLYTSPSPRDA